MNNDAVVAIKTVVQPPEVYTFPDVTPMHAAHDPLLCVECVGRVRDTRRGRLYSLKEQLGGGKFGTVYSAVESRTRRCVVLKEFVRAVHRQHSHRLENESAFRDVVEREYFINKFAQYAMRGSSDCERIVRTDSFFFEYGEVSLANSSSNIRMIDREQYEAQRMRGFICYDERSGSMTLNKFCSDVLYKLTDVRLYRVVALAVAELLCHAVSAINDRGIYHRDLKPDNILLRRFNGEPLDLTIADDVCQLELRLIDFGVATVPSYKRTREFCVHNAINPSLLADPYFTTERRRVFPYVTNPFCQDPRSCNTAAAADDPLIAHTRFVHQAPANELLYFTERQTEMFFPRYELFAVAANIQVLFDPERPFEMHGRVPPEIRRTQRMPTVRSMPLFELLCDMTGQLNLRPNIDYCALQFEVYREEITRDIIKSRTPLIPGRPPPTPPKSAEPMLYLARRLALLAGSKARTAAQSRFRERRSRAKTHPICAQ